MSALALFLVVCYAVLNCKAWELKAYNPVANPLSVVQLSSARFTILTENLIRMEYDPNEKFEDRATVSILNRYLPKPDFSFTNNSGDGSLTITTQSLTLTYAGNNQPFGPSTLSIIGNVNGFKFIYNSSSSISVDADNSLSRNLFGTIRTLDGINDPFSLNCTQETASNPSMHCTWAVFGRDGYALINDTNTSIIEDNWLSEQGNKDSQDWYFFGHGLDFKLALKEFHLISGSHSLVPRYSLGSWHSRWYDYSDLSIKQVVNAYENHFIPLDVIVLDMNWHLYGPWGAYTYHQQLFPYPNITQQWFHSRNLRSTANIHDDNGIQSYEMYYSKAAADLGVANDDGIPFNVTDYSYMMALMDDIMQPITQTNNQFGFDFWWIDWQQGESTGVYYSTVNPTIWLNYIRHTNHIRLNENIRGLILARYGGYGNQRYPIGFSGDCGHSWAMLAWLPYFSATASNVGYEWSHDIMGETSENELNTRWIQFGAYSSVFRIHDRGEGTGSCANTETGCIIIDIYEHPWRNFNIERSALHSRAELLPYLYNASYTLYSEGIQIMRPMYYEYPLANGSYLATYEYMLGNNLIVSPIANFSGDYDGFNLTLQKIWIPPGVWYETHSGLYFTADDDIHGNEIERYFDLDEYPIYVRVPSIISMEPMDGQVLGRANNAFYQHLRWDIFATPSMVMGGSDRSTILYEDDGYTYDYIKHNASVITTFKWYFNSSSYLFTANVQSYGNYTEFDTSDKSRNYSIRIVNVLPPKVGSVKCGSTVVQYISLQFEDKEGWYYNGNEMAITVNCPKVNPLVSLSISMQFSSDWKTDMALVAGMKGKIHRAVACKQSLDAANVNYGTDRSNLTWAAAYSTMLGYIGDDYEQVHSLVTEFEQVYIAAILEVTALPISSVGIKRAHYCQMLLNL